MPYSEIEPKYSCFLVCYFHPLANAAYSKNLKMHHVHKKTWIRRIWEETVDNRWIDCLRLSSILDVNFNEGNGIGQSALETQKKIWIYFYTNYSSSLNVAN